MARSTFTVSDLAKEAGIDIDETLLTLWDDGIDYVVSPRSVLHRRDANRARGVVGLATRRELASRSTWQSLLELEDDEFENLLNDLGISIPQHRKLTQKAIRRLRAEARARGILASGAVDAKDDTTAVQSKKRGPIPVAPPFKWKSIGQIRDIKFLIADYVRAIHQELVHEFAYQSDPIYPPGVRDENLLESAMSRPRTSMGEHRKYPSVEMSAAALMHSLIHNHAFHNGNKRTALVSMLAFLDSNRMLLTCEQDELFKFVLRIAQHSIFPANYDNLSDREVLYIAEWINRYSRRIELGDRTIPFRRLRTLLAAFDCICESPKGNHISVTRSIQVKRMFRKDQEETLLSRAPYRDEGRDISRVVIARIRKELQLDEFHGIDSATFYDNAPAAAGEFIIKYRKTLHRLASL